MSHPTDGSTMPRSAAAHFTALTEGMGFRPADIAEYFSFDDKSAFRRVRRWVQGVAPIPVQYYKAMEELYEQMNFMADELTAAIEAAQARGESPTLSTQSAPSKFKAKHPNLANLPPAYYRAILLRVWEETGATILYDDVDDTTE